MKKLTKLAAMALGALAMFITTTAKAQSPQPAAWSLGIGLEAGIPTGNATDISNFAIGGTLRLEYATSKTISVMLTSGYYDMVAKMVPTSTTGAKYPSLGMV